MGVQKKDYNNFKHIVIDQIEKILADNDKGVEDEYKGFALLCASLFSDISSIILTDGPKDQGIDFYLPNNGGYDIFQCKFCSYNNIRNNKTPVSYNEDGVLDIQCAHSYLKGYSNPSKVQNKIKLLRANVIDKNSTNLNYYLCCYGRLSDKANSIFKQVANEIGNDGGTVKLIDWYDIIDELWKRSHIKEDNIVHKFKINNEQVLRKPDYCYFLAYVSDFYKLFEKYGWAIFDLNVRSELRNSKINSNIRESLMHEKTMRQFHHLNNGILLLSNNYSISNDNKHVKIYDLQIINGCQTVRSISRAYKELLSHNNKSKINTFNKESFVQVKVINYQRVKDFMDDIIISTNNQNPMTDRNLKSNTQEQKNIKVMFDNYKYAWYYQRKYDEFDNYRYLPRVGKGNFKVSNYTDNPKKGPFRVIDNKDLALAWASYVGLSSKVIMSKKVFSNEKLYNIIFNAYPSKTHLTKLLDKNGIITMSDKYYNFGETATAHEYLLSYIIYKFIKTYIPSHKANRNDALNRGIEAGIIKTKGNKIITPKAEQDALLLNDDEYMINNMMINCKELCIEMYSYILSTKYGFGHETAAMLLLTNNIAILTKYPEFKDFIETMEKNPTNILWSVFEMIKFAMKQVYLINKDEYLAAPRRKAYLATKDFNIKIKNKIYEINNQNRFHELFVEWKENNKNFIDSLPNLG